MPDDTMLPEDDRDLSLARRLGAMLNQRASPDPPAGDDADASFQRALRAYKEAQADAQAGPTAETSARLWTAIEQQIVPGEAPRMPEPRPALRLVRSFATARTMRLWLAAASVLALVAVGWLLWNRTPTPVLLASADIEIVTYTAPDGSVVRLRPHSHLYAIDGRAAAHRLVGEAFFDVVKQERHPFTVEAGAARIEVLGTRFNVSTWGGQTAVYLKEGRVRLAHVASGRAVVLDPGQRSLLTADGRLLPAAPAPEAEYLDWLNRALRFDRHPLRAVLDELSHHYAVTFDVPDAVQNETVTGRILLDQLEQSLDDLGVILDGRFVEVNDTTYRFVPN